MNGAGSLSKLESHFLNLWKMLADDTIPPEREWKFHEERQWRFDFAWPEYQVAVELEGGVFSPRRVQGKGRHLTSKGFHEDCGKYNAATADGWLVLRFDAKHLDSDPVGVIELVVKTLRLRGAA